MRLKCVQGSCCVKMSAFLILAGKSTLLCTAGL